MITNWNIRENAGVYWAAARAITKFQMEVNDEKEVDRQGVTGRGNIHGDSIHGLSHDGKGAIGSYALFR